MDKAAVLDSLQETGLVPVLRADSVEKALALAGNASWRAGVPTSGDKKILRPACTPFEVHGGLGLLQGNLGKAIVKTSAIAHDRHVMEGAIRIFHSQEEMQAAFHAGELHRDVIVVVRFQGPRANGMPELHKLLPPLQSVQSHGFKVALVTDGRLSGASGDVLSAIHLTPEAADGGPIAKLQDGDRIRIDANTVELCALVEPEEWESRPRALQYVSQNDQRTRPGMLNLLRSSPLTRHRLKDYFTALLPTNARAINWRASSISSALTV